MNGCGYLRVRSFGVLSDKHARLGENGSPKRGLELMVV